MMTTSDNSNNPELEDIFSEVDTSEAAPNPVESALPLQPDSVQPLPPLSNASVPATVPTEKPPVAQLATELPVAPPSIAGIPRRTLWVVASVLLGLLLLSGISWGIYYWYQGRTVPATSDTSEIISDQPVIPVDTTTAPPLDSSVSDPTTVPDTASDAEYTDTDHDGLSDAEELVHNTNPKKKDTDDDGLSDREEIRVYLTDPRNPDTDGDGYSDGVEVANFYHPNDPNPNKKLFELP